MPIYTKTGDQGQTGLFDGTRIAKDDLRIEAIGAIDELNAQIGVITQKIKFLETIQSDLFAIGGLLAGSEMGVDLGARVIEMEREIDRMWKKMSPLNNFILPRGQIHVARVVCRRAERTVVRLVGGRKLDLKPVVKYLNRLSDYFFALARFADFLAKNKETVWKAR